MGEEECCRMQVVYGKTHVQTHCNTPNVFAVNNVVYLYLLLLTPLYSATLYCSLAITKMENYRSVFIYLFYYSDIVYNWTKYLKFYVLINNSAVSTLRIQYKISVMWVYTGDKPGE